MIDGINVRPTIITWSGLIAIAYVKGRASTDFYPISFYRRKEVKGVLGARFRYREDETNPRAHLIQVDGLFALLFFSLFLLQLPSLIS